jgi:hypothetical protein
MHLIPKCLQLHGRRARCNKGARRARCALAKCNASRGAVVGLKTSLGSRATALAWGSAACATAKVPAKLVVAGGTRAGDYEAAATVKQGRLQGASKGAPAA